MKTIISMNNKGQSLVVIMGILIIFMIFIPVLVFMVQNESKWTAKQKRATDAFHAAEAGVDRGKWKLQENSNNWNTVVTGGEITDYDGIMVYDLYADTGSAKLIGQYKVDIFQGPGPSDITIRSKGRDASATVVRCIEAVLSRTSINSPLDISGGITYKPNILVHWGPVVSFTSMDLSGGSDWFPRKYSVGQIDGRDTNPTAPNSDGKEYWAFEDLGTAPQIDTLYYKNVALTSRIPTAANGGTLRKKTGNDQAVANPAGSGFYPAASNNGGIRLFGSYQFSNSTSVIYTDGTIDCANGSFVDVLALVGEGNIDFNAGGGSVTVTIPGTAPDQYTKKKEMSPGYLYPGEGNATHTITSCGMHGFLYCGGNLNNSGGGSCIAGAIKVIGNVTMNTVTVYYDAAVASNIRLSNANARQISWREVQTGW